MYPVAPVTRIRLSIRMGQHARPRSDLPREPIEDEFVEGPHGIPVKKTEEPMRREVGCHCQERLALFWLRLELQPGLAGQFHLGPQAHHAIWFHFLHAPEVERL